MKQQIINAGNAEFAAQFLTSIPYGYIDKTICGCGLTTVALENDENVVLAVPSVALIENKKAQYPNSRCAHRIFPVYGDMTSNAVTAHVAAVKVGKIMVTYDSLHKVAHLLEQGYRLIIDESDKLLALSNLKASNRQEGTTDVINQVLEIARKHRETVSFISATPTPLAYMPEWLGAIPNIKIVWENTTKVLPYLLDRPHPYASLSKEILIPLRLTGSFTVGGVTATKAIIFLNSLQAITNAIKSNLLPANEVAILCGDNLKNATTIAGYKALRDDAYGNLPRYTFITSSGFQGIDLYDKDAASIVVSCTARKYSMIDLLTDLKQASSRNRDKSNPNYGKYIYIYNQSLFSVSEEDLVKELHDQRSWITRTLSQYDKMIKGNAEDEAAFANVTAKAPLFKRYAYEVEGGYTLNEMLFNADEYHVVETRRAYVRGFDVVRVVEGNVTVETVNICSKAVPPSSYRELVSALKNSDYSFIDETAIPIDSNFSVWGGLHVNSEWVLLCKASYAKLGKVIQKGGTTATKQLLTKSKNVSPIVRTAILKEFVIDKRYSRTEVKDFLTALYKSNGIDRVAKYSDLLDFFELTESASNCVRYVTPKARKK